jgi:hypothetical protein
MGSVERNSYTDKASQKFIIEHNKINGLFIDETVFEQFMKTVLNRKEQLPTYHKSSRRGLTNPVLSHHRTCDVAYGGFN